MLKIPAKTCKLSSPKNRMSRIADWFIHGEVDWDWWQEQSQKWSPVVAGGLFGGGERGRPRCLLHHTTGVQNRPCCHTCCPEPLLARAPAAWWVWADALVYEQTTQGLSPPFKYQLPGIVATVALLLINLVSRYDLTEIAQSGDEGADVRCPCHALCWAAAAGVAVPTPALLTVMMFIFADARAAVAAVQLLAGIRCCGRQRGCAGELPRATTGEHRSGLCGAVRLHPGIGPALLGVQDGGRWRGVWIHVNVHTASVRATQYVQYQPDNPV